VEQQENVWFWLDEAPY